MCVNFIKTCFYFIFVQLPDNFVITLDDVVEELVVGGVFLRLFISQPNWVNFLQFSDHVQLIYLTNQVAKPYWMLIVYSLNSFHFFPCVWV